MQNNGPHYAIGRYVGTIIQQGFSTAGTGTMQFVIRFRVDGKINSANPDGELIATDAMERTVYLSITEAAISMFTEALDTLDVHISSFNDLDPRNANHISLAGKEAEFYCGHERSPNGMREKWSVAKQSGFTIKNETDTAGMRKLDALYGKHLNGKSSGPRTPRPQPARTSAPPPMPDHEITDDDIPY